MRFKFFLFFLFSFVFLHIHYLHSYLLDLMQEQQQNAIPRPLQNFSQNNPVDTFWFSVKQFLEKFSSTLDNEQCVLYALLIK